LSKNSTEPPKTLPIHMLLQETDERDPRLMTLMRSATDEAAFKKEGEEWIKDEDGVSVLQIVNAEGEVIWDENWDGTYATSPYIGDRLYVADLSQGIEYEYYGKDRDYFGNGQKIEGPEFNREEIISYQGYVNKVVGSDENVDLTTIHNFTLRSIKEHYEETYQPVPDAEWHAALGIDNDPEAAAQEYFNLETRQIAILRSLVFLDVDKAMETLTDPETGKDAIAQLETRYETDEFEDGLDQLDEFKDLEAAKNGLTPLLEPQDTPSPVVAPSGPAVYS